MPAGIARRRVLQAALRVRLPQHQVDVVHGLGAAARPDRQPAAEQERHLGVPQEARDLLQSLEQLVEGRFVLRHGYALPDRGRLNRSA